MLGIWRSPAGVGASGFPARQLTDTPGKRAEGPGSPKPGKMEPEWPENEGWTCWCGWFRVSGPTPYWSDSPIGHVGPLGTDW